MKKITGYFFIAAALFLLGTSIQPLADQELKFSTVEAQTQQIAADERPRLFNVGEFAKTDTQIKKLADELPRLF
ncbi:MULTISPECIES: hypothetical protein [Exiguobacterium]|uniref:hypothetical protein n=1 Tax=Exiguobacterium TaxID=33986 RepID=UPI001BE87BE2|nr:MULTISPECIES: hypothetical protein [Exiguobacterium]MCT4784156.1 hypothetical protein [Exiguobacterium himgiriensis]